LNGDAEVNYLEDCADVHENQMVCPTHDHKQPFLQHSAHLQCTERVHTPLPETGLGQGPSVDMV